MSMYSEASASICRIINPVVLLFTILATLPLTGYGANDFGKQYQYGKDLYKSGKYGPSMEIFLPLTREAEGNKFVE